jgi:DNA-binding transcriptional regulator YiaG
MATSTEVKRRYNEKTYKRCFLSLKNDDFDKIEEIREASGLSRSEFLKMLVSEKYDIKF